MLVCLKTNSTTLIWIHTATIQTTHLSTTTIMVEYGIDDVSYRLFICLNQNIDIKFDIIHKDWNICANL